MADSEKLTSQVPTSTPSTAADEKKSPFSDENKDSLGGSTTDHLGANFRAFAAAIRGKALAKKAAIRATSKQAVRKIGSTRPLHFASEGAVAGNSLLPRWAYYGAWGVSGLAITADVASKSWDAPADKGMHTALYWTAFHIPASLVVPAYVIHQVVHGAENFVKKNSFAQKKLTSGIRASLPVAAAVLAIVPVVPIVDHFFESIMEPTLGNYLGLKFHPHGQADADKILSEKEKNE